MTPPSRLVLPALVLLLACTERPSFVPGDECELNTECGFPLVCRLGHCRVECRIQRDCGPGLECVRDNDNLGICQLPEETGCTLTSMCPEGLVCIAQRCTNECEEDRDCPPGANCMGGGCRDQSMQQCQLTSDCEGDRICALDHRCREACHFDRDCRDWMMCLPDQTCGFAEPDAGMPDAGPDSGIDSGTVMTPNAPLLGGGFSHTCAAPVPNDMRCWGLNTYGQLGDGTFVERPTPTGVMGGLDGISVIGVGPQHTCAATSAGLRCWGDNANGQLGVTPLTDRTLPTPLAPPGVPGTITDLALGNTHTCAIASEFLYCWGSNAVGQAGLGGTTQTSTPTEVAIVGAIPRQVDSYADHTCVVMTNGSVRCFGRNANGQLGDGTTMNQFTPVVALDAGAVQVVTGQTHTCALLERGDVVCWGLNDFGQLGNGTIDDSTEPVRALVPEAVVELSGGRKHTCGRTMSGDVYCWGDNVSQQNGAAPDPTLTPTRVAGLPPVLALGLGTLHTCALVSTTPVDIRCFGENNNGQLGDGMSTGTSATPISAMWTTP